MKLVWYNIMRLFMVHQHNVLFLKKGMSYIKFLSVCLLSVIEGHMVSFYCLFWYFKNMYGLFYLRLPQTVPTCWRSLLYYIFPSKKQSTFLDFHSFACWLSIKNVRVWSSSMFDNRPHDRWWWQKHVAQQESGYGE